MESTSAQILCTKLHRPQLCAEFVPREELLQQFEQHRQLPLTLVRSPYLLQDVEYYK